VRALLFHDAGQALGESEAFTLRNLRTSSGVELRVNAPMLNIPFRLITATLNSQADDDDALEFPVNLTAVTVAVKQASGGIVTPPTGGEVERYDYVTNASTNVFPSIDSTVSIGLEVWYDLPSLRREALVTVTLAFTDDDGQAFTKAVDVRVSP
jgi:hypothetical protein